MRWVIYADDNRTPRAVQPAAAAISGAFWRSSAIARGADQARELVNYLNGGTRGVVVENIA
jgi:hypothetical protein